MDVRDCIRYKNTLTLHTSAAIGDHILHDFRLYVGHHGTSVNAIVFVVWIRARQQFVSGDNRLIINLKYQSVLGFSYVYFITIINQCVLDLFSCFFSSMSPQ